MKKEDILVVDGTADSWEQAIHLAGGTLYENGFVKEGFEQGLYRQGKDISYRTFNGYLDCNSAYR